MRRDLLDQLDCPLCQTGAGLEARVYAEEPAPGGSADIGEALLSCPECGRWWPISGGVADLVRDALREPERDAAFLARHGLSDSLRSPSAEISADDQRILDEGRHWGAFMRRFWDVGDRSIFDVRIKGTHPPYYVAGVAEPDDRDHDRRYGVWPDHLGAVVFPWLGQHAGRWGVEVGCGGGQYGLEAARQGVLMASTDPSFEALELARRHALEQGVAIDYLRAEPAHLPFRRGRFGLLLAKDSLHHVPDLEAVFPRLVALLTDDGEFGCYEHIGLSPWKRKLLGRLAPRLVEKMRRRWPLSDVPEELLRDSANEDVSMDAVEKAVRTHFEPLEELGEIFFYFEFEQLIHFAYGKRRWLTRLAGTGAYWAERLLMRPFQPVEHWAFHGRRKNAVNKREPGA